MKDYSQSAICTFDLDIIISIMINKQAPPALLILDPQNDFFGIDNPNLSGFLQTIPAINTMLDAFHRRHWPVIVIQHTSGSKPEGSEAWNTYPAFCITTADQHLSKRSIDAFEGTPLNALLHGMQVRRLVIAGYAAEHCVTATFRTARSLGYLPILLADGTASLESDGENQSILQGMQHAPASDMIAIFDSERKSDE